MLTTIAGVMQIILYGLLITGHLRGTINVKHIHEDTPPDVKIGE